MKPLQIAIDGPVASGKSTIAARLARRLGCAFLDTGILYRAVAWLALKHGVAPEDEAGVVALIDREPPSVSAGGANRHTTIRVGTAEPSAELFSPEVARAVSPIAAMPGVRERLVPAQRAFADDRKVVMAGRDIGTVILPHATVKFFLTASLEERVERRLRELRVKGVRVDRTTLSAQIQRRDERDIDREASPLVKAPDAIEIDTTHMTPDQVVDELERRVRAVAATTI